MNLENFDESSGSDMPPRTLEERIEMIERLIAGVLCAHCGNGWSTPCHCGMEEYLNDIRSQYGVE